MFLCLNLNIISISFTNPSSTATQLAKVGRARKRGGRAHAPSSERSSSRNSILMATVRPWKEPLYTVPQPPRPMMGPSLMSSKTTSHSNLGRVLLFSHTMYGGSNSSAFFRSSPPSPKRSTGPPPVRGFSAGVEGVGDVESAAVGAAGFSAAFFDTTICRYWCSGPPVGRPCERSRVVQSQAASDSVRLVFQ